MARRSRGPSPTTARRKIAATARGAISDFENDFKKAVRVLALLIAVAFVAKQSGGLSFPLTLVLDIKEEDHAMSDQNDEPDVLSGDALAPPSTIRLPRKLKAAVDEKAKNERTSSSEIIRRVLETHLCGLPATAPLLQVPDPTAHLALEALRIQLQALQQDNKVLCEIVGELRSTIDREIAGQNQALNFIGQAVVDLHEAIGSEGAPSDRERVRAFLQKHLRLQGRSE